MNIESMEPAMQWIFGNIILIWMCNICVLFYASCNEPIMKDQITRIERLELQNRAIGEALTKLNSRLTVPVQSDEIASLKADFQKHKSKTVNRRRIIESSDDEE
jgi:hypothetical protein